MGAGSRQARHLTTDLRLMGAYGMAACGAKRTLVDRRRVVATTQKSSKRDCGQIYGAVVHTPIACHGHSKPIAPASPWQNGFAARLIGSIRRGCVDHIIVPGEAQPFNMKRRSSA